LRQEVRRFLKFLAVGAMGFVVDTGTLTGLVFFARVDSRVAKGVAFCMAVLFSFVWNRFWTYRESRAKPMAAQVAQFLLISLVGLGINVLVFGGVDHALSGHWGAVRALYAAQVMAVGTALIWNFAANRLITYGDVKLGQ
jgi:putative flippase GtrA